MVIVLALNAAHFHVATLAGNATGSVSSREIPQLLTLQNMRVGVLRIVSSTTEHAPLALTKGDKHKGNKAETDMIEHGGTIFAEALSRHDKLGLAAEGEDGERFATEISAAYRKFRKTADNLATTADRGASPEEVGEIKEMFEAREQAILDIIDARLMVVAERAEADLQGVIGAIDGAQHFARAITILALAFFSIYGIFVFNMIRELAAAHDRAETANRAKSAFLSRMSHDLRTPLNAIIGFSEFISNQYFGPVGEKYQGYANDIRASGQLLLLLIKDILDLSAIESGKQSLSKEDISITDIVTECEAIIKNNAQSAGLNIVTEVSEDLPPLYADRQAVTKILINPLFNSIKFTPEGGKITLSVTATNDHHTIKVSDTGVGIPADKIATITDPFIRDETDPHHAQKGSGIGLSIVKSLVDLHDGKLEIKSTVGKGTTVTVTLPNGEP